MAYEHKFITDSGLKVKKLTGMSAIREKCLECCNWSRLAVRECSAPDCALFPFRFGKYPKEKEK